MAAGRHVLWIVGPALGHASRCLLIARELRASHGIDSHFIGSDRHGFHARLLAPDFGTTDLGCAPTDHGRFADGVLAHARQSRPGAICIDCSPVPWMLAMPPLPAPTVYLTNHFLSHGPARTLQDDLWQQNQIQWCAERQSRGLRAIASARALYEASLVLFCDPSSLVPQSPQPPANAQVIGACCWTPAADLPAALEPLQDVLFVSFGSTGRGTIPAEMLERLARVGRTTPRTVVRIDQGGIRIDDQRLPLAGFVPTPGILGRSGLALTHGGTGSTYQAMAHGVPTLVWPAHRNHHVLGESIEDLGIGVLLDPSGWTDGLARFETDFDALVSRSRAHAFDLAQGPAHGARLISELLRA